MIDAAKRSKGENEDDENDEYGCEKIVCESRHRCARTEEKDEYEWKKIVER